MAEALAAMRQAQRERDERHKAYPTLDDPAVQAAIAEASGSPDIQRAMAQLTATGGGIRGCQVNPDRAHLQVLQNLLGWPIGGYDTRPTAEGVAKKNKDRLEVLVSYRQPADPGNPPRINMYDYLCDTLFGIPMRPVGPEVEAPQYEDEAGNLVEPHWVEGDWDLYRALLESISEGATPRPDPVFQPNMYPYQLPEREATHELQRMGQHWILWYLHYPWETVADPPDTSIEEDVRKEVHAAAREAGFEDVDYIWYRNPGMSVPELFHVQVFWIVPEDAARAT